MEREDKPLEAKLFYDIMDVARLCSLSRTTVYSAIADGRLQKVKSGRRALIPASSLSAFYASLTKQSDEQ